MLEITYTYVLEVNWLLCVNWLCYTSNRYVMSSISFVRGQIAVLDVSWLCYTSTGYVIRQLAAGGPLAVLEIN